MLTWEEDVQAHALRRQGWTISAIARHLGRDRKTIRAFLRGERTPGVRVRRAPDPFEGLPTTVGPLQGEGQRHRNDRPGHQSPPGRARIPP
jgi:transcriptional regulator with XRE-family HTH domain